MGLYVIQRTDGRFVCPPGEDRSYTDLLQDAWLFRDRAEAQRNCCPENETVRPVGACFRNGID